MSTVVRIATPEEKEVVQNMDQFYLYEFARFMPNHYKLDDDGLFHDEDYEPYWRDPDKYPYLILHDAEKAGFALVEDKGEERVLTQFFVLYKFQGQGVARTAALNVFGLHPGNWAIHSLLDNPKSEKFWPKVVNELSAGNYTVGLQEPRRTHHVYRFSTWVDGGL
jgi:predicted acetyltransferase